MDDMSILRAAVATTAGTAFVDVIQHAGKFWLVPYWCEYREVQVSLPMLAICLNEWPHERIRPNKQRMDFVVNGPLPKVLFGPDADKAPEARKYVDAVVPEMRRRRRHQMI